jgi:redox-sensing transcriptional repressor
LKELGFKKVFSHYIAEELNISSEQVRKDFSLYGIKGYKKAGYDIDNTLNVLNEIFGRTKTRNVIIMGMGHMGRAMVYNNENFRKNKFQIVAAFDINPTKRKTLLNVPVYKPEELNTIVKMFEVKTAIITVPAISAQLVCNNLVEAGITGIMSFVPIVLKVPPHVAVNNVNLCNELEATSYTAMTIPIKKS